MWKILTPMFWLWLALLAAGWLSGCATVSGTGPVVSSLPAIAPPDLEERALLLLLADRKTYEPVSLGLATDGGPEVRRQAALTVGRIGDPRGIATLERLLGDEVAAVRRAAAFAFGELGEQGHAEVARALVGALGDVDRETGRLAVEALAKVGADVESVVERLIDVSPAEFYPRLLPSLYRFQRRDAPSQSVVRWAKEGLAEDDPDLRAMAVYALARTPQPEGLAALRELVTDAEAWSRGWAARALGEIGERSDVERLRPLLDDAEGAVLIQALRAASRLIGTGKVAAPFLWQPRLLELLSDPRPGVRLTAIEASAAWLLDQELITRLEELASGGQPRERQLALLALAEGEAPQASSLLTRLASSSDPATRVAAAQAAGLLAAISVLEQLSTDADANVRAAALATWLDAEAPDAVERASRALLDRDAGVRATVLEWAVEHPVFDLEVLKASASSAKLDRILDARLAAVQAIGSRAATEPLERGALIALLEELATEDDLLVRHAAATELGKLDAEAPTPGPPRRRRPAEIYREIVQRTATARRVAIETSHGDILLELDCPVAPLTCLNFLQLAGQGFYDGLPFHRVVPDFVVQTGDPRGDGRGGPGYAIRDEINLLRYRSGVVGMALSGPDTGGSQFFVTLSPQPHLDGGYTVFGHVVAGIEILAEIVQGDRILTISEMPSR
jgi:cyclophilin family peptidyl-prolyl cis-trans isomerase/HEAT repeat protein